MSERGKESINDINQVLKDLIDAKNVLSNGLSNVRVSATQDRDPDVITAVRGLFGDGAVKDGKATITFKMFAECIDVVRKSGKAKAKELIV